MTMIGETTRPENWKAKLAELWYQTKLADTGVQIEKDLRRQKSIERLVKKTQDGTLGQATSEPMDEESETVNVGNEIHHHHGQPKTTSPLVKGIATAGLAVAGLGAGVAAPIAAWNLTRKIAPAVTEQPTMEDTDTKYGIRIFRGEEK